MNFPNQITPSSALIVSLSAAGLVGGVAYGPMRLAAPHPGREI
jgi:hypothetical protein